MSTIHSRKLAGNFLLWHNLSKPKNKLTIYPTTLSAPIDIINMPPHPHFVTIKSIKRICPWTPGEHLWRLYCVKLLPFLQEPTPSEQYCTLRSISNAIVLKVAPDTCKILQTNLNVNKTWHTSTRRDMVQHLFPIWCRESQRTSQRIWGSSYLLPLHPVRQLRVKTDHPLHWGPSVREDAVCLSDRQVMEGQMRGEAGGQTAAVMSNCWLLHPLPASGALKTEQSRVPHTSLLRLHSHSHCVCDCWLVFIRRTPQLWVCGQSLTTYLMVHISNDLKANPVDTACMYWSPHFLPAFELLPALPVASRWPCEYFSCRRKRFATLQKSVFFFSKLTNKTKPGENHLRTRQTQL